MKKLLICLLLITPIFSLAHGGEHEELIIRMTEEGFEPKELTVWQGDEVLFINNDDVDRWPASNFHPTHSLYSEFDSMEGVPPGESWTFIFDNVGTWRMHDHLIPHMTGTIVVLEDPEQDETLSTDPQGLISEETGFFSKIKNFFSNLWQKIVGSKASVNINPELLREFKSLDERAKYTWLEERARIENPETAWRYVLEAYNTPQGVVGNPHDMAHLVGQLIYDKYGFDGLSTCTPVFAFGCYHGLMEVALYDGEGKTYQERLAEAETGCGTVGSSDSPTYWSCIHGIGHGVATYREHDINLSLSDCDLMQEGMRTYCHDGVFMEFSISAPPSFYQRENPIHPCDIVGASYKTACARSQVQVMRLRFGLDTGTVAHTCLASGNNDITYHCIDALGYFTAQESAGSAKNIISGCRKIDNEEAIAQCMSAAAGELVFQNSTGWQKSTREICSSLSRSHQEKCDERVDNIKQSYGRK
ncbi:MAG: hypothetical protein WDZ64_00415 [Parcubacteria group bacterium]